MTKKDFCPDDIIEMAWCDKTSFDDIQKQTSLGEKEVIDIMRRNLKPSSFRLWRKRVSGRVMKHAKKATLSIPKETEHLDT